MPINPAVSVHGPLHVVKAGKMPMLEPEEARALLDSIDVTNHHRTRHRPAHLHAAAAGGAYVMIRRRAAAAGVATKVGNHSCWRPASLPT